MHRNPLIHNLLLSPLNFYDLLCSLELLCLDQNHLILLIYYQEEILLLVNVLRQRDYGRGVRWPIIIEKYFKNVPSLKCVVYDDIKQRKTMGAHDYHILISTGVVTKSHIYRGFLQVLSDEDYEYIEDVLWYNRFILGIHTPTTTTHPYSKRSIYFSIVKIVFIVLYRYGFPLEMIRKVCKYV